MCQYLGKLLFWTFMALAPDAPSSGRSLQSLPGQLEMSVDWMAKVIQMKSIVFQCWKVQKNI